MKGMESGWIRRRAPVARGGSRAVASALLAGALLLPATVVGPASAQTPRPGGAPLEDRLRQRFGELVQRELDLDEETQRALAGVLERFDEERRDLARRTAALRVRLAGRASLDPRRRGAPLLAPVEAREILDDRREIREDEFRLAQDEEQALLEVLTEAQLVRFLALRDELTQRIQRMRRGRPGGPGSEVGVAGGPSVPFPGRAVADRAGGREPSGSGTMMDDAGLE